jgi:tRNA threonylcarbamoyladenosine biosynthesis protein TsaE
VALHFHFRGAEDTLAAGRCLGRVTGNAGLVLALAGSLGAGKTVFVKGFAAGLGIDPNRVASPTFVLCHEYAAPDGRTLAHVDLYRVNGVQELEEAGFLDLQEPGALLAVEWGDRFPEALPRDRLDMGLSREAQSPDERRLIAVARGPHSQGVLDRWARESASFVLSETG